jgi:hypothetical protein
MKTRIFLAVIMVLGMISVSVAQEEKKTGDMKTIFGNSDKRISHGGYGAITVGWTQIDNEDVITLGGRAAWVIDHHVALGLAGKAFMNSIFIDGYWPMDQGYNNGYYLVGGYGGLMVEPIIGPNMPVHVSFPIMIGGGGLALNEYTWHDYDLEYDYYEPFDWDSYFVFEPGVEVELNLMKFFRIGLGASYRLTTNMHMQYVPKDMMNGFSADVSLKFGKF